MTFKTPQSVHLFNVLCDILKETQTASDKSFKLWNVLRTYVKDWDHWVNESTDNVVSKFLYSHKDNLFIYQLQDINTVADPVFCIRAYDSSDDGVVLPLSIVNTGIGIALDSSAPLIDPDADDRKVRLGFKKLDPAAKLPCYAHEGDAGMDVFALNDVTLEYGVPTIVKTGLAAEIPDGYEIQVRPRSGLAAKGVTVWNSPGTIDSKYRGEIGVILMFVKWQDGPLNEAGTGLQRIAVREYQIKKGDKIAQLVLAPVTFANPVEVEELSTTERGAGGFGSTGR